MQIQFWSIRSHDLHAGDIRGAVGEIISYHVIGSSSLRFFGSFGLCVFWPFFGLPFCLLRVIVPTIDFLFDFCPCHYINKSIHILNLSWGRNY